MGRRQLLLLLGHHWRLRVATPQKLRLDLSDPGTALRLDVSDPATALRLDVPDPGVYVCQT